MLVLLALAFGAQQQPIPAAQLAPYPPMHWHSWNTFCHENAVNEGNMKEMADALIETGMAEAGYDMVCRSRSARPPSV